VEDGPVNDLSFSLDDRRLALIGGSGAVQLWDLASRKREETAGLHAIPRAMAMAFAADEIYALDGGKIQTLRLSDRRRRTFDTGEPGSVVSMGLSPAGDRLAAISWARRGVRLWDVAQGTSVKLGDSAFGGGEVVFSRDGSHLWAPLDDHGVEEWDLGQ